MSPKEVKRIVDNMNIFDKAVSFRNGVFIGKRTYFYHHGCSVEKLAAAVKYKLPNVVIVAENDYFKRWPATSYMEVRFKFVGVGE